MSVKTTGAEYKAYMADQSSEFWPEGSWIDSVVLNVNGIIEDELSSYEAADANDDDQIVIESGVYFKSEHDYEGTSLVSHFKRWRKAQTHVFLTVQVPREKLEAVQAAIKAACK